VAVIHGPDKKLAFDFSMLFTTHTQGMFPDILFPNHLLSEGLIIRKQPLQIRLSVTEKQAIIHTLIFHAGEKQSRSTAPSSYLTTH
jgi:hypothetical protein